MNGGKIRSETIQNPMPVNLESVFASDLDIENSNNGDFNGGVADYFDSLKTVRVNSTIDNPKTIMLWFNRTIYAHTIGLGCDDLTKSFGDSITIELLGSGEVVRKTVVSTGDANSRLIPLGARSAFNGINIKFNTATEVALSNITIQKAQQTNSTIEGADPDGNVQSVNVTEDGDMSVSDNSSGLAIAEGKVTKKTFIHKFGHAGEIDVADTFVPIWDGAGVLTAGNRDYNYSITNDINTVSSSNVADTHDLEIQGLDINYELITQTVTLNGQNKVTLTTPLLRVFRMFNNNSSDFAGNIYCYVDTAISVGVPTDTTKIRAIINNGNNQTLMALYTVPAGKTAYMRDYYVALLRSADNQSRVKLWSRLEGKVFRLKHQIAVSNRGTSAYQHRFEEPEVFTEKTDIYLSADADANDTEVSGGFDIVLKDN